MDTGQMMSVMQQMPAGAAAPQAIVSTDQGGGAFAGMLQGVLPKKAALTDPAEVKADRSSLQGKADPGSQNVVLDMNGAQLALLIAQLNGRMPEAGVAPVSQSEGPRAVPSAGLVTLPLDSAVASQKGSDVPAQQGVITAIASTGSAAVTPAGLEDPLRTSGAPAVSAQPQVNAMVAAAVEQMVPATAGNKIEAPPLHAVTVAEGDKPLIVKPPDMVKVADVAPLAPAENRESQPEVAMLQVGGSSQVATDSQPQPELLVAGKPELVAEQRAIPTEASLQQPTTVVSDVTGTGNDVVQPENQTRMTTVTPTPTSVATPAITAAKSAQELVQGNERAEAPAPQAATIGQQEQPQNVRPVTPAPHLAAAVAVNVADRPEAVPSRLEQREVSKTQQNEKIDIAKTVAAALAGEQHAAGDENETPDQGTNGNFPSNFLHQQVKTEGSLTVSNAPGAVPSDTSRTTLPEQVVQQVKDRLVNHETKPGSEQIVLRLSPEHLGELKVNLNLEGQRLKVEIVAENRMVRDSLMQHTDALKESLSRQNIKMESFDVTTGGNGSADSGRGQGGWRELAQQRQQNAWMPEGGYRLAKQTEPVMAAYQVKSEHTMVDLHF